VRRLARTRDLESRLLVEMHAPVMTASVRANALSDLAESRQNFPDWCHLAAIAVAVPIADAVVIQPFGPTFLLCFAPFMASTPMSVRTFLLPIRHTARPYGDVHIRLSSRGKTNYASGQ
jgi:hypothetical protein